MASTTVYNVSCIYDAAGALAVAGGVPAFAVIPALAVPAVDATSCLSARLYTYSIELKH
jgi:hypothetical protein